MRKMAIILAFMFGLGLNGYYQAAPALEAQQPEPIYIALIAKGLQANYWNIVEAGAQRAAEDYDAVISFEGPLLEGQIDQQIRMFEGAALRNPAAIALSATDSRAIAPYVERVHFSGIPVIGFDSGIESPVVRTTVATDNYGAGMLAAARMAEYIGQKGQVGIVIQDNTSEVAINRRNGFIDTMAARYPDIQVVAVRYGAGNPELSSQLTKEIMRDYPQVAGIFGGNEGSAYGVIDAVRDLGKESEIVIVGFDSGQLQMDAIREGIVAGAVTQNPFGIGYQAVETAIRVARGESVLPFINTGFTWYDRTNIDNPEIRQLLYQ